MKNIIILAIACLALFSCSNMESDAENACDCTTQTMEMMPQFFELSMKAGIGDEDSKKEAQKELDELHENLDKMTADMESIKGKYDEEEFKAYLLENCESAKKMFEMGEAFDTMSSDLETIQDIE